MKKFFFMAATAALALSSCSSDELVQNPEVNAQEGAVSFSAYSGRQTRDQAAANTTATNKLGSYGFGVFAYEQGTTPLSSFLSNTVVPNFFYNQKVLGYNDASLSAVVNADGSENVVAWAYNPVKYFSNNPGALHSFFAYAPHTATLSPTSPNLRLLTNSIYGGPALEYTVDLTGGTNQVDILTAPATVDMAKPSIDQRISFSFKHALSSLKFNVQAWVDAPTDTPDHDASATNNTAINDAKLGGDKTKITVKSLKLIGNFAKKGVLRLVDGKWDTSTTASETIELLASDFDFDETKKTEQKLLDGNAIYFIPQDGDEVFKIQITYEVTTTDGTDSKNSSTITNTIVSEEAFPLAQNTAYEYHLNLGMTTVKFNAVVADWNVEPVIKEVDLPANTPNYSEVALTEATSDDTSSADASTMADQYIIDTTDNKLYVSTGSAWESVVAPYPVVKIGSKYYVANADGVYAEITPTSVALSSLSTQETGYYLVGDVLYHVVKK